ncbi:NAD(P)H-hydrate dehydratase [Shimia thalassica]|uniref:NAD(P)H-hydrate dehydratase n=1 Tax=Shimia thalassica TaxID=1715693 RepID=UPI0026E13D43|nr:NAD(P)H-hydrate dehydratase [Shimia thalassica]MDO6483633.1 NAD(P)H-hydrate dehydratase [Shimia thalassica]
MTELLTAAQMRAIETAAIESGEVTGLELMERAGAGVVEAIFEEWPEMADDRGPAPEPPGYLGQVETGRRAVVLCGPGNNGGDGFVVARLLRERGWQVEVFLYGDAEKLPPDARTNYARWCEMGEVTARAINPPPLKDDSLSISENFDLLVDGLFGTGLGRPFGGLFSVFAELRGLLRERGVRVVGIDVPTGLCSDSGKGLGAVISADLTVSFHASKLGHVLGDGGEFCGRIIVKSIGLEGGARPVGRGEKRPPRGGRVGRCPAVSPGDVVQLVDGAEISLSKEVGHKFSHGHALILSGGAGKTGAARLAARGALRVGAGVVTLGVPHEAQAEVAAQITAVMMREMDDAGALATTLGDKRLNALCLGPGMGFERARELVPVALGGGVQTHPRRSVVLDADALSAYADAPETLFEMLHERCVLTPHAGEFKRLFPEIATKLEAVPTKGPAYSKVDATREAAARAGCVVLFKGPDTVIADQNGRCSVNAAVYERSAPWLATAGSGDVLAGFITGLLARGFAPMQAAETGAWLHVECARTFGPGLIAEDLPEQLPDVLRSLGA